MTDFVEWKIQRLKSGKVVLEAFGIMYRGNIKYFFGKHEDLLKFKENISRKVFFKGID